MDRQPDAGAGTLDVRALRHTAEHLAERYDGIFTPDMVERCVFESYAALARTARVRTYLAATAGHFANNRLQALARSLDQAEPAVPLVLFVCPSNIGSSQIAAALLEKYAGNAVEARSAGARPGSGLPPLVLQALREAGADPDTAYPKPVTDDLLRAADYVVTIGDEEVSRLYPGKQYLDWNLQDPGDAAPEQVHALVTALDDRVKALWNRIRAEARSSPEQVRTVAGDADLK